MLAAENVQTGALDGPTNALGFTLEDFYTSAINYSPRLRIADERRKIGGFRRQAANGRLLPQLNAGGSVTDNRRDDETLDDTERFDGERFNLQLSQILFNWQEFSSRRQAYMLEDQAEAEYFVELSLLLTDVADRYFLVLQAEDALESIRSELNAVTGQLELTDSYYQRQLAQITDLYEAQAQLAAVQAQELELQSQLELAREALRAESGISVGQLFQLAENTDIPVMEDPIGHWIELAIANSKRIQASEFARQAAEEQISGARGAYMPQVNVFLQRQDSNVGFDNRPLNQTKTTYGGVSISIPIYAGGSSRAAVSEAVSQHAIAQNELRRIQLDVTERTRTAYLQVKASEQRTEAARVLAESTALAAEAMQQGFELGTVNSVDVLTALRDQFQAERDLQRARYEHVRFLLALYREAGTLSVEDLLEVSTWLEAPEN